MNKHSILDMIQIADIMQKIYILSAENNVATTG